MLHQTQGPVSCVPSPPCCHQQQSLSKPGLQCPHQCAQKTRLLWEHTTQGKQVTG